MAETAFLTVRCPACGASSDRVPARLAGRTVRCPRCAGRFAVPTPGVADSTPAAPAVAEPEVAAPAVARPEVAAPTVAVATAQPLAVTPTAAPPPRVTGHARTAATAPAAPAPTTPRADLRRATPVAVPALPGATRGLSRGRIAVALFLLVAVALAWLAWRHPPARVRLSPHMAEAVPKELDLIDLRPFRGDCSPGDYERHLERLRSGNPDARDVACLAARGGPGVVADVLDGAPLASPDAMTARRLRRNAASALAGLRGGAIETLCERLGDEREEARAVAAMALGVVDDPAATACVRARLGGGGTPARAAAAALRQRVTRGLFPVSAAWTVTTSLLAAADPYARIAGLLLAPLFTSALAEPAVRPLLEDADPDVAEAAREAHATIERVRETDRLSGDGGS
jgi:ribosomal protein S27E